MKKLFTITLLLFVAIGFYGCSGEMSASTIQPAKVKNMPTYKKHGSLYVFDKKVLEDLLYKKNLSNFEKQALIDFIRVDLVSKNGADRGSWSNLKELRKGKLAYFKLDKVGYMNITKTVNGYAILKAISYEHRKTSMIVYYSNDFMIEKIVYFPKNANEIVFTEGANFVAINGLNKVFDLKSYNTITTVKNLSNPSFQRIDVNKNYFAFSKIEHFWVKDLNTDNKILERNGTYINQIKLNNDYLVFSNYSDGFLYNLKENKYYCQNDLNFESTIKHIIWQEKSDIIYFVEKEKIMPIFFKDGKCYHLDSYKHNIPLLSEKLDYRTGVTNDSENLLVISRLNDRFNIYKAPLKNYSQNDIYIKQGIIKAGKLLDSGFEKRGLKLLDKLATENYEWNGITILKTKKYKWAYRAYLAAKHFNKRLYKAQVIDKNFLIDYRAFIGFATWYNYEWLIAEAQKRFKKAVNTKKLYNEKEINDHIAVNEAIYLLSINKDEKAYDLLFEQQPFSDYAKEYIKGIAVCKNSLTKNLDKLSVATDIPKEKFENLDCTKVDPYPFFFDIDGNKVFKSEKKNKTYKKKKLIKTKNNEAIELLD